MKFFQINRRGITRTVLLVGRYAIKIPCCRYQWKHFLAGLLANMQEVEFSKMNRAQMCPVIFHLPGGWLLVMPRCTILTDAEFEKIDEEKLRAQFIGVPVEHKADSFGIFKENVVAVDYGGYPIDCL